MKKDNVVSLEDRVARESRSALDEILQEGAREMLQTAIENEVEEYIQRKADLRDEVGHRLVVRNGSLPQRDLVTGVGPVRIKQPRIHDRREGERFTSKILPPFMRRVPSIDALIPALYLKGISTGSFNEALEAILGPNVSGLSATNVLDKLPKKLQPHAKTMIHEMYLASTKEEALEAYEAFFELYEAKYPKPCACLAKDKDVLFTFYDFPAEHWRHIRSTNPIESTFATVRHRTRQTKGCGSRKATLSMVFKLSREAEKRWRRINGHQRLAQVIQGIRFVDREAKQEERQAA